MANNSTPKAQSKPDSDKTVADLATEKAQARDDAAPTKAAEAAEKDAPAVALCLITTTGADGHAEDVLPGTVFRPSKADVDTLKKMDAIREPTDAELALFKQVEAQKAAAADENPLG